MQCKSCGAQLAEDSIYCPQCGCMVGEIIRFCPFCGTKLIAGQGNCPQCQKTVRPFSITGTAANAMPISGAGVFIRALATACDAVILSLCAYIIAVLAGSTFDNGFELQGASFGFMTILSFAYYLGFEGSKGATPGKVLLGLKVIKLDGSPCDYRAAVIRTILRIVDGLPCCYFLGAILVWCSSKNQRLGDRIAETIVVKENKIRLQ